MFSGLFLSFQASKRGIIPLKQKVKTGIIPSEQASKRGIIPKYAEREITITAITLFLLINIKHYNDERKA